MKRMTKFSPLVPIAILLASMSARAEQYVIVKEQGYLKEMSYQVMTFTDYNKLNMDVSKETAVFSSALKAAEKEWNAGKDEKKGVFPARKFTPRKLMRDKMFPSEEKAQAQVSKYEEKDMKLQDRKDERAFDQMKDMSKEQKEREEEKIAKEEEKLRELEEAKELLVAKIAEALAPKTPAAKP